MSQETAAVRPGYADFLSANRGGNLFTLHINQRIGACCALIGHRLGLSPTGLTLINLVFSIGAAISVIAAVARAWPTVRISLPPMCRICA